MSDNRGSLAHRFWQDAANSKLAPPALYARQRQILEKYVLPCLKPNGRLLDIGCGDGEFTEVLARDCIEALGIDLSPSLIDQARQRAAGSGALSFEVGDIRGAAVSGSYDIVACMGLFTCIVRPEDFIRTARLAVDALKPGGYLVLKDSLILGGGTEHYFRDDRYEALYRTEAEYLAEFTQHGLRVVQRHPLHTGNQANQVSVLYLLHRPVAQQPSEDRPCSGKAATKIAIFHQLPESWVNVRSVWECAVADPNVEPIVVVIPFFHDSYDWRRDEVERHLASLGVPFVPWDEFSPASAGLDTVIYTSPYDETRPNEYRFEQLRESVPCIAYVPYGLEVGGGEHNLIYQYGQPVTTQASAVFVRSAGVKRMFAKHCPTGDRHVVVSGHPRMDGLVDLDDFPVAPDLLAEIGGRRAVLWNAHFSFDSDQWSTFDRFAGDIFTAFDDRPDLALLFRPHPLLWKKLVNLGIFDESGIAALKEELRQKGVVVDERADHRHAFAASTAMLSDVGSFLMEYLCTGKPVLYLRNPFGLGLNEEGEAVVRHYQVAEDKAGLVGFLDALRKGEDFQRDRRLAAIPDFFYGFDGGGGRRVIEHLKATVGK